MSPRLKPQPVPPLAVRQQPGLSETLTGPRAPQFCQSCGQHHSALTPLTRWLEHDEWDRLPTKPAVVVLCQQCAKRLIEPHHRLYRALPNGASFPGCMSICVRCRFRDGVACSNPAARTNGGPGLSMRWETAPTTAHLNYGGGRGEWTHVYFGPVLECSGRELEP